MPWHWLDPELFVGVDIAWNEIFELCYIPMFGGGFGLSYSEAISLSRSDRRRAIEWLNDRRKEEHDTFKGKKSPSHGTAPTDFGGLTGVRTPTIPRR